MSLPLFISIFFLSNWKGLHFSLRKHPFLLALRRWGRFARRNLRAKRPQRRRARRKGCFRRLLALSWTSPAWNIDIKAENSSTLCKFHKGRKGLRPMGSNADPWIFLHPILTRPQSSLFWISRGERNARSVTEGGARGDRKEKNETEKFALPLTAPLLVYNSFILQWNLNLTKCERTGEICSLYREFVISKMLI